MYFVWKTMKYPSNNAYLASMPNNLSKGNLCRMDCPRGVLGQIKTIGSFVLVRGLHSYQEVCAKTWGNRGDSDSKVY
jgi:hypothetical protein